MIAGLWIVASLATLALAGAIYQGLGSWRDRRLYTGMGRWVRTANGCGLFLCELGEGEPTVVFESGIGATHLNWRHIQEEVSGFARTISYDRAGLGWSDAPRTERTPVNVAAELQQMLERAGVRPPFILVGHSFGGLVMRRFALLYPGEVAGILLVDPMRCEEWPPLNPARQGNIDFGKRLIRYALPITQFGAARLAVTLLFCRAGKLSGRLAQVAVPDGRNTLNRLTAQASKMPRSAWPIMAAHWSRPSYYAGLLAHLQSIPQTVREMHIAEPIRSIPVTVITPHAAVPLNENQLEHIGSNVRQLIAEQSEHWIHLDEPALVIECIRDLAASTASVADCAIAKTRE